MFCIIQSGWTDKENTRAAAQSYWHCRDELFSTEEEIICWGLRRVVQKAVKVGILNKFHLFHSGIIACKTKAREYIYF